MTSSSNTSGVETRHSLTVSTPSVKAPLDLLKKGRKVSVLDFSMADGSSRVIAFKAEGPSIENLDESSDARQVFGACSKIKLAGETLGSQAMVANSLEELKSALAQAQIKPFSPEEI